MRALPAHGNAGDDEAGKTDSERRKWAFGRMRAWTVRRCVGGVFCVPERLGRSWER